MSKHSVLFVASEVFPFAKSGGLADVAHALPRALNDFCNIDVVMPLYSFIDKQRYNILPTDVSLDVRMGEVSYKVELYSCIYESITYFFIYNSLLCEREFLYGSPEKAYEDNALRFGIFNYGVLELLKYKKYDIAHLNDWQSALIPLLIKEDVQLQTRSLFTIHNLAYQGVFEKDILQQLGLDENYFSINGLEFYSKVSFMKAGIAYADALTTVSPNYAREILTPEFGCGLEGFLSYHSSKLEGIINGIDTKHFSPSDDKALVQPYKDLKTKSVNKKAYLKETKLKGHKKPLFIFIGRFTWQKGIDLLVESLDTIATLECNVAILGDGEEQYHHKLQEIADRYNNIYLEFGYDESRSHRMYAATDFLLMPSVFEPCGLNQLIAMHYGAVPVVHGVGGLVDTVHTDTQHLKENDGCGMIFYGQTKTSFVAIIQKALQFYKDKKRYKAVAEHNMRCDFSWGKSAQKYVKIYNNIREQL